MKIDADLLKDSITEEKMMALLSELGASYMDDKRDKGFIITDTICHNHKGQGSNKLYYYPEGKTFHCYTGCSHSFDIYGLVQKVYKLRKVDLHFSSVIEFVAQRTGYQQPMGFGNAFVIPQEKETTGDLEWLNKISHRRKYQLPDLDTYHEEFLQVFSNWHHPLFLNDGIGPGTLDKYKIKFYEQERRIVIPYHDHRKGNLIGLRGRTIDEKEVEKGRKYMPITVQGKMYNFPTHSGTMYGLHQNMAKIRKCRKLAVFESEKSVLQCDTMYGEDNFSTALSGKSIPLYMLDLLIDLGVEEVLFCYDKMYDEFKTPNSEGYEGSKYQEYVEFVLNKVKQFVPYMRVFVVQDTEGLLEEDDSPSDKGQEVLERLMKNKTEVLTRS